jgi:hypothetical protein
MRQYRGFGAGPTGKPTGAPARSNAVATRRIVALPATAAMHGMAKTDQRKKRRF